MQLNYKVYGEGHPLVILHGLFGSLDNWHTLGKRFGEFFKVFALDQMLKLPNGAKRRDLEKAMKGHVIGQSEVMGRYSAK